MINREFLNANHASLVAEILAEGRNAGLKEGREQGASAERSRIQDVEAQALPGHEKLIAGLKFDGKTTGPEAAAQVLAAEKQKLAGMRSALREDAPDPAASAASATGDQAAEAAAAEAKLPLEERCKKRWERDEKIRGEFHSLEAFTAYQKAAEKGHHAAL